MNNSHNLHTVVAVVPQLFFDIIARIIPGPVILISLFLCLQDNSNITLIYLTIIKFKDLPLFSLILAFLIISLFYISSILFYGFWDVFVFHIPSILQFATNNFKKCHPGFGDLLQDYLQSLIGGFDNSIIHGGGKFNNDLILKYDKLKILYPSAGIRITKLRAELHMSGALAMNFLLCSFLSYRTENNLLLFIFFLCFLGAIGSNLHYSRRLITSIVSNAEVVSEINKEMPVDKYLMSK